MMKLFEDKVYKDMDWLEAACQPVKDSLNDILNSLDDEIEVEFHMLIGWSGKPSTVEAVDIVEKHLSSKESLEEFPVPLSLSLSRSLRTIATCFEFSATGQPKLDFESKQIVDGSIKLIKVKSKFTEEETEKRLIAAPLDIIDSISYRPASMSSLNEMCELLGLHEARKLRAKRKKVIAIDCELADIFKTNAWNIKDVDLACKVAKWIKLYIEDGNLAALSNFCKLKVMTHDGQPIYSIASEEQV
jgi:hypothetical protein